MFWSHSTIASQILEPHSVNVHRSGDHSYLLRPRKVADKLVETARHPADGVVGIYEAALGVSSYVFAGSVGTVAYWCHGRVRR